MIGGRRGRTSQMLSIPLLATAWVLALACGDEGARVGAQSVTPDAIADQAGAVCGMLVREEPAPRGQVVHRDGTKSMLCSIGDLLVYLSAPSPHGAISQVFVEALQVDEDPLEPVTRPHAWIAAETASFVVGVPRERIMGPPVLAYADREAAEKIAHRYPGAITLDFAGLTRWWGERGR